MWLPTSILVVSVQFLFMVNAAVKLDSESTSSLLSRSSSWDCTSDSECTTSYSSCLNGYCECNSGYVYNSDLTSCILAATAYGDACNETAQCSAYLRAGGICEDEVCVCADGYHYIHGRCYLSSGLGEACTSDTFCYVNADTEATSCVDGVCVCSDGFYQREYRTCRRIGYAEGDECAIDLDCQFENGVCSTSFICTTSTTTATRVSDDYKDVSRVARSTVGTECTSDDDCSALLHSSCGAFGTCVCDRAYYASTDSSTCLPEIGEECSSDDSVTITNSLCRNGTWSCGYSTVASINQQVCRKSTKAYDTSCVYDEQCYIFGPDGSCQSKRCLCDEGSHYVEDLLFCWISKGIGESCLDDEDCYVDGLDSELSCTNSVCTCPNGTSPNSANTLCKSDDGELGAICDADGDCSSLNAACIDSACGCPDNYFVVDDYCGAGINATCSSASDCLVANSTCTDDNVCDCADNFVSGSTGSCLATADNGEECEYDIQCSTAVSNSYCATTETTTISADEDSNSTETYSTCECESDYHYRFGQCYTKTVIGESCTNLGDCYVESGIEDVVCRKGVCTCNYDSSAVGTTGCSRVGSDASTFFISTWMSVLLLGVKIFII